MPVLDDATRSPVAASAGAPAPVLRVRGLRHRYGNVVVLRGVDLDVHPDELVALVGENGVGKTTIVRCVAGGLEPTTGRVDVVGPSVRRPDAVQVVWQDLALCDNLDVVDNLFLGRERSWRLPPRDLLQARARTLLDRLDVHLPDLAVPVGALSGGQRQSVALARTLVDRPTLLVLDEPTAALSTTGVEAVRALLRLMRAQGVAILLVSHDLDLVCEVADRALVLRDGRIVDDVRRPRLVPDELRARMSGVSVDGEARGQLLALRSLVHQLADVEPSAVVPLIVSALAVAVEHDRLAVHLVDERAPDVLRLAAGLGLRDELRTVVAEVPLAGRSSPAVAVARRAAVVVEDVAEHDPGDAVGLRREGVRSAWSVPLVGGETVLGTITGYGAAVGPVADDVLELASLYASHAAAALERDRLLRDVTRRNATLETLRRMLERLAGPVGEDAGLAIALAALREGLGAEQVALLDAGRPDVAERGPSLRLVSGAPGEPPSWDLPSPGRTSTRRDADGRTVMASTVAEVEHRYALVARWSTGTPPPDGAADLVRDGVRAVRLALERSALEDARQEAVALRRSNELQRTFLSRLSHELRTPLTAIHGYADTLRQPDIAWDDAASGRFLDTIVRESARLGELVLDLLDASSIEAGVLRLQPDWCDVPLVVAAAVDCVPIGPDHTIDVDLDDDLPPLRADHDRVEQVLVNLVGNAVRHTPRGATVTVAARVDDDVLEVRVSDDGPGLEPGVVEDVFRAGVRGDAGDGGPGLGLAIGRGIARAHGGDLELRPSDVGACFVLRLPLDGPPAEAGTWTVGDDVEEER